MIRANLRLVVKIARDYVGRGMLIEDLIGEGNLGLIRAAEEFDPRFGTRFSTYASYWIKQAIRHALINTTSTIRLPAHMVGLLIEVAAGRADALPRARDVPQLRARSPRSGSERECRSTWWPRLAALSQLKLESGLGDDEPTWSPDEVDGINTAPPETTWKLTTIGSTSCADGTTRRTRTDDS